MKVESLSTRTLLQMAARIGLVVLVSSTIGYYHMMFKTENMIKESGGRLMTERQARERAVFDSAKQNHSILSKEFLRLYERYRNDPKTSERFNKLVGPSADGALRNADPSFNGATEVGIFIGRKQNVDMDFQARILASYDVTNRLGLGYHHSFQDTYFTFPENGIVLYWPEFPDWTLKSKPDFNIVNEEYHQVSVPEKDPHRSTAWTGLFYDEVSKIWMVTAATPIYDGDRYIASVHHDVMVNELFQRTIENQTNGADSYFIVREDGRLILHPDYQSEIQKGSGQFDVSQTKNQVLQRQFEQIKQTHGTSNVIEVEDGEDYLAVAKIDGPDWYLVTCYPKSMAKAQAADSAAFVLIAGLLSLLVEILVLFIVLQKQISVPLIQLIRASDKIAQGQWHQPIETHREDELGRLADSFNHMADAIQDRDNELEAHARNLEKLVMARTKELDEQKMINIQASKMSALGEMAGGIAHEINTPLGTIKLLTSQLIHEMKTDIPDLDSLTTQVQKIENTADRVAKIVRGLKTFARDANSDPFEATSAQSIVNETIELCSEKMRMQNVKLKLDFPKEPLFVHCRSIQIGQVLLNLISNAQDAIELLPEKWIEISVREQVEWIEIRVTDSGSGISKENQEKIFQPFFTTKGIGKGTGMGLSISLGIIKAHHGQLTVDSTVANTCFVLRLHRHKNASAA